MRHALMFGDLIQDLRIGMRGLLRAPMMTATIVATVALGIRATTVPSAALMRPFTFAAIKMLLLAVALAACCVPANVPLPWNRRPF